MGGESESNNSFTAAGVFHSGPLGSVVERITSSCFSHDKVISSILIVGNVFLPVVVMSCVFFCVWNVCAGIGIDRGEGVVLGRCRYTW